MSERQITHDDISRMKHWSSNTLSVLVVTATPGIDGYFVQWFGRTRESIKTNWRLHNTSHLEVIGWYLVGNYNAFRQKINRHFKITGRQAININRDSLRDVIDDLDRIYIDHMKTDYAREPVFDLLDLIS